MYKFIHLCYWPISLDTHHNMVKVFRQSRRNTSLRRRFTALSANDSSKLQKLKRVIVLIAAKAISSDDKLEEDECQEILENLSDLYLNIAINRHGPISPPDRYVWTIEEIPRFVT